MIHRRAQGDTINLFRRVVYSQARRISFVSFFFVLIKLSLSITKFLILTNVTIIVELFTIFSTRMIALKNNHLIRRVATRLD